MFFEFDTHLSQVLRAYPHVLKHIGIVVRNLASAHGCADVVMRNPHLVTHLAGPGEVASHDIALLGFIRYSK
ncbi:hypothetical protein D3C81_2177090 [compost metagenome]